jgi:signal transduction histidine kinase
MEHAHEQWLALLTLGTFLLAIAVYGWRSSPYAAVNRNFAIQTLVVTWWVIGIAGTHSAHVAEFWGRWTFAAAALMPAAVLAFADVFPAPERAVPKFLTICIRLAAFGFAAMSIASSWIAHSFVVTNGVLTRSPGPLMRAFSLFFLASAAVILVSLAKKWSSTRGLARAQLRLYSLGLLFFCVGAITTNLLSPSIVGDSRYSPLGPCFVLIFLAFVAHGIIRHRLMNVRLVVHNWLTVSIASSVSVLPLLAVILRFTSVDTTDSTSVVLLLIAGVIAPPIWMKTRYLLHRYVYRGDADFRTLISNASSRLSKVLAQKQSAVVVIDTIFEAVRPEGVAIYLAPDGDGNKDLTLLHARQSGVFGLPSALPSFVTKELIGIQVLASFQSVAVDAKQRPSRLASEALETNHWALIISLAAETQLIGAMAVGRKLSGDPYYLEDVGLLQVLASQATVAFSNGQLYERVLLANQHIENIVATAQSGIVVAYDRETMRLMNEEALRLLGLPSSLRTPAVVSVTDLPKPLSDLLNQTWDSGSAIRAVDLIALPVMCSTAPLRKGEEIVGVVGTLSDLSTMKALEIERTRAERLNYFETLAAGLAHEIANPIAPIKIMTQLLPSRYHNEAFIREFTRTVTREISRMERLVERLRRLSRPANRDRVPVDLRTVLTETFEVMQSSFEERRVTLSLRLCDAPLVVAGDPNELHELFLNLLTNAAEATPDEGQVLMEARPETRTAWVRVSDSGTGIPAAMVERIFEPFVSSKQRGSGLGLTICSGIVQRHEGTLDADNTGSGAAFTVRIPLIAV